jgi:hypothetical protein
VTASHWSKGIDTGDSGAVGGEALPVKNWSSNTLKQLGSMSAGAVRLWGSEAVSSGA